MFSCKRASELISAAMDRDLSLKERVSLRAHLLICSGCRAFRRQLATIRHALRGRMNAFDEAFETSGLRLSAEARNRIRRVLQERLPPS